MPAYLDIIYQLEILYPNGITLSHLRENQIENLNNKEIKKILNSEIQAERLERVKETLGHAFRGNLSKAATILFNSQKRKEIKEKISSR